jgi:ribonuclease BN (tRNA processing enzyme)
MFKRLSNGESVTLADGTVVSPDDCHGPEIPGERLLVVDCWSMDDVRRLPDLDGFSVFVHFTPHVILNDREYIEKFPVDKVNLCFAPTGETCYQKAEAYYTRILERVGSVLQPLSKQDVAVEVAPTFISLTGGDSFVLEPLDRRRPSFASAAPATNFTCELPSFRTFAVTVLGTSARSASPERNVPGFLIHYSNGFVLLDPGEGTLGQIRRRYGRSNTAIILEHLQMVWVSHTHHDHVGGLRTILEERARVTGRVIPVACGTANIRELAMIEGLTRPFLCDFVSIDMLDETWFRVDGLAVLTIPVFHCQGSKGCVLDIEGKWRVAYSGDRGTMDQFIHTAGKVDLLIHESTFIQPSQRGPYHSILEEALITAFEMDSTFVLLTHFSQTVSDDERTSELDNVVFAFDFFSFAYEDCPTVWAAMRVLYRAGK